MMTVVTAIEDLLSSVDDLAGASALIDELHLQLLHKFRGWPTAERREQLLAMPYQQYLQTVEWRRTRALALALSGYGCQCCEQNRVDGDQLHVHHRHYDSRGAEFLSDLVVLCHVCHARIHGRLK